MKHIIVTGAKGGTGRSIVDCLRTAGYAVTGLTWNIQLIPMEGIKK